MAYLGLSISLVADAASTGSMTKRSPIGIMIRSGL